MKRVFTQLARYARLCIEVSRERGAAFFIKYAISNEFDQFLRKANHLYSRVYAKALNKPLIYVIGDSHTGAFTRNRSFIVYNIGPATAYNLRYPNSTVGSYTKLFDVIGKIDVRKDYVLLVFGEIDCRVHIYNEHKKSGEALSITDLIDRTIVNYGEVLGELADRGVNFLVYGVLPASKMTLRYPPYATRRIKEEIYSEHVHSYPYSGSAETRSEINAMFNEKLKEHCRCKGYRFIDIYPVVSDGGGFIRDDFAHDEIHVNWKIMPYVKEVLKGYDIVL